MMKATYPDEQNPYNRQHRDELPTTRYITAPSTYITASTQFIIEWLLITKLVSIGIFGSGEPRTEQIILAALLSSRFRSSTPSTVIYQTGSPAEDRNRHNTLSIPHIHC